MKSVEVKLQRSVSNRFICKHSSVNERVRSSMKTRTTNRHNQQETIDIDFIVQGHTNAVRSLCVMDDESNFLSGGRDQKLLIWKVENQNDHTAKSVDK
jgi:WD40 repeat protein